MANIFLFFEVFTVLAALTDMSSVANSEYVTVVPGNINLIISMPHGGLDKPEIMEDRGPGCNIPNEAGEKSCKYKLPEAEQQNCPDEDVCKVIVYADKNTAIMGWKLVEAFKNASGFQPHVVKANVHRSKVDFNRVIENAAQYDVNGIAAYIDYHSAVERIRETFNGSGLLLDIHGQTHKQNSTELGYVYRTEELNNEDYETTSPSIRSLMERFNLSPAEILYGPDSLGAYFEDAGYRAVPSPRQHIPGTDKYYRGGYITQSYGSNEGGLIDAIQIEMPSELRYESGDEARDDFAEQLGHIVFRFFNKYYHV